MLKKTILKTKQKIYNELVLCIGSSCDVNQPNRLFLPVAGIALFYAFSPLTAQEASSRPSAEAIRLADENANLHSVPAAANRMSLPPMADRLTETVSQSTAQQTPLQPEDALEIAPASPAVQREPQPNNSLLLAKTSVQTLEPLQNKADRTKRTKTQTDESPAPQNSPVQAASQQKALEQENGITPHTKAAALRNDGLQVEMFQRGQASYYADKFHGLRTANGEYFDMQAMTAAHKTLPFDTVISVTNLHNGKSIKLRINDRGPYIAGRIIDVSKKAAEHLGMINSGVVSVKIVILSLPEERKTISQNPLKPLGRPINSRSEDGSISMDKHFAIQIASYSKREYAYQQFKHLEAAGIPVHMEQHGKYHRLIIVNLNQEQVAHYRKELAKLAMDNILVRQE